MRSYSLLISLAFMALAGSLEARGADPLTYSWEELSGSAVPYPEGREPVEVPDSLTPLMVNHVGRHGARYPTSCTSAERVRKFLMDSYEAGTLTPSGIAMLNVADSVELTACGLWGRLDPLGIAEQRDIAARLFMSFPQLFGRWGRIQAMSSRKPRCMMSMDVFIHQLALLNETGLAVESQSGTALTDTLLRFFDINSYYRAKSLTDTIMSLVKSYEEETIPDGMATRILERLGGRGAIPSTASDRIKIVKAAYDMMASCGAMAIEVNPAQWFTKDEYERLWADKNYSQYLRYSASEVSAIPAAMAAPLLREILATTDAFLAGDGSVAPVVLRFGHAETLMPLLSLMRIPGAYYITSQEQSVAANWRNFDLVPMAANVRLVIFRAEGSGGLYARLDVNEEPVAMLPGSDAIYIPWAAMRDRLASCLVMPG